MKVQDIRILLAMDDNCISCVLYEEKEEFSGGRKDERTAEVQPGDGFWAIAERCLGDGSRAQELAEYNDMNLETMLYTGMVLRLPN